MAKEYLLLIEDESASEWEEMYETHEFGSEKEAWEFVEEKMQNGYYHTDCYTFSVTKICEIKTSKELRITKKK